MEQDKRRAGAPVTKGAGAEGSLDGNNSKQRCHLSKPGGKDAI